jgi:hypothetical protein
MRSSKVGQNTPRRSSDIGGNADKTDGLKKDCVVSMQMSNIPKHFRQPRRRRWGRVGHRRSGLATREVRRRELSGAEQQMLRLCGKLVRCGALRAGKAGKDKAAWM